MRKFLPIIPIVFLLFLYSSPPVLRSVAQDQDKKDGPPTPPQTIMRKEVSSRGDDKAADSNDRRAMAAAFAEKAESKRPLNMMRLPAKADGVELTPATQTVATTKRVVIVTVKSKVDVGWFITHDTKNPPVEWFELPSMPFILIFPNNVEETINVYAYTAIDGKPTMAKSTIVVRRDAPGPTPKPDVEPDGPTPKDDVRPLPAGSKVHITIIRDVDAEKSNPQLSALVTNPVLIKGLQDRKHWRWVLDKNADAATIKTKGFEAYMTKVGRLPMYIVQDDKGLVLDYRALEGAPASVLAAIDKLAPPIK